MINFRKIFETFFKSFDVSNDLKLVQKLEKEGMRFLMIVKRHWFYGIIHSRRVLIAFIVVFANTYLLIGGEEKVNIVALSIGVFLLLNVFYWVFIIGLYLYRFYKVYGSEPYIEDVYSSMKRIKISEDAFTKFFNQTIFIILVLFFITIFVIFTSISSFSIGGASGFGFGVINIFLLIVQVMLFYGFLKRMINLEMDFKVSVPGELIFYNQNGLLGDTQSMNSRKIKTMNTEYPNLIASFFNYGNILILSEGDQKDFGEMKMDFIGNPKQAVSEMQKVFNEDLENIDKNVNVLLKKFKSQIGIDDISSEENKQKMKDFIKNNEQTIKAIYEDGNDETKREVKELYK